MNRTLGAYLSPPPRKSSRPTGVAAAITAASPATRATPPRGPAGADAVRGARPTSAGRSSRRFGRSLSALGGAANEEAQAHENCRETRSPREIDHVGESIAVRRHDLAQLRAGVLESGDREHRGRGQRGAG